MCSTSWFALQKSLSLLAALWRLFRLAFVSVDEHNFAQLPRFIRSSLERLRKNARTREALEAEDDGDASGHQGYVVHCLCLL